MKIIIKLSFTVLMTITMIFVSSAVEAGNSNISGFLNKLSGTWYDSSGNAVLYIDYNGINGLAVKSINDLAGGGGHGIGTFRIVENGNYKDLRIEWDTTGKTKYLIVNNRITLQNTQKAQYFESIGGIHLGMTDQEVLSAYGSPTSIEKQKSSQFITWLYDNDGWEIRFYNDRVDKITILKNGNRRLDKSGYNCDNSLKEFAEFYNIKNIRVGVPIRIAEGEYLWIYKDMDDRIPFTGDGVNVEYIILTSCGN